MTWHQRVIWSEGLFLQPQHFQQQERHWERRLHALAYQRHAYGWGYARLEIDPVALGLGQVALDRAAGVMPDGTPFDFPDEEAAPAPLVIPADARNVAVLLALPLSRPGAQEVDDEGAGARTDLRYLPADLDLNDLTRTTETSADVRVALPNLRLMLASEATDGYATLGTALVLERQPDNRVVLDARYAPPTLDVQGMPVLGAMLREVGALLRQRGEALVDRVGSPGKGGAAEIADFLMLQTVGRHQAAWEHLTQVAALHPETMYRAALALAGDLAVFRDARLPPAFPGYVHDDLRASFQPVIDDIRQSLSLVMERNVVAIPLQERSYGVRVAVIADLELLRTSSFVLAVGAQMPGEALRQRFPAQTKVGPTERIRDLVNLQLPGIGLRALPVAPRQIPFHAGFNYFELERHSDLWRQLERSGNLAMHVAGEFPGLELECWAIRG